MMNATAIPMLVGRLGFSEILIILVILLVLFGPKDLPKIGKRMGETVRD